MAEHHYILKFDDETGVWSHDVDSEEARFPDGTIWDEAKQEWVNPYQGDGEFIATLTPMMITCPMLSPP